MEHIKKKSSTIFSKMSLSNERKIYLNSSSMKITSTLRHVRSKKGKILQRVCKKMVACFSSLKWVDQFRNISQQNENLLQIMN